MWIVVLALATGCSDRDSGSIDLAAPSAEPPPPKKPGMPAPGMPMHPGCLTGADCPAATPWCAPDGRCVECLDDTGCTRDPARRYCALPKATCVACRTSADCDGGDKCAPDQTCKP